MSGGGSSAPAVQPSTTTTVQDIPAWEQPYVENLLGQAQTIAQQPYQQFPGQQVAGFTPDQSQAFSNVENMAGTYQPTQNAALGASTAGAGTANSIYGAGAGDINAATGYNPLQAVAPYLGAAAGYNSAAASQPWLNQAAGYQNAAANTATPQGIQNYMSPYTNDVVQGIQNEANLNWNQNIMPGVNNEFIGSGQYGSGRNAQVLGQAAGNFQTGLSSNVANALESGYTTAGNQAATQAGILGNLGNSALQGASTAGGAQSSQITNLLNQGQAAGTATQGQAANLQTAGTNLGNLAATQGAAQLNAGTNLQNLSNSQQQQGLLNSQALQGVGQQQQQLNQTNLNTAQTDWQNQVNWPAAQTQYLNQIIRGLPTPTSTTSASQTPAYSVSPLAGIGGAGTGALSLLGSNGQTVGTAVGATGGLVRNMAKGGMVGYADGGEVDGYNMEDEIKNAINPLDDIPTASEQDVAPMEPQQEAAPAPLEQVAQAQQQQTAPNPLDTAPTPSASPLGISQSQVQQMQLLALARGMLTPQMNGSAMAALGQGMGNVEDITMKTAQMQAQQNAMNWQRQVEAQRLALEQKKTNADITNQIAERQKPIPDGYGGFIIPNTQNPSHPTQVDIGGGAGGSGQSIANIYHPPTDKNGDPLRGEAFLSTIPDPIAAQARLYMKGDAPPPTGFAAKPTLLAAQQAASIADPTWTGQRYSTIQDFTKGPQTAKTVQSQNVAMEHIGTLQTAVDALKNGDVTAFNRIAQEVARQTGSPIPTNFELGKTIVGDELAKAVLGANSAQADRDAFSKNLSLGASNTQATQGLQEAGKYMAGQAYGLETRYKAGSGLDDYRQRFQSPAARKLMETYYPSGGDVPSKGAAPASGGTQAPSGGKVVSQSDLATTAQKYGKSVDQVRKDAIAKGYTIQ